MLLPCAAIDQGSYSGAVVARRRAEHAGSCAPQRRALQTARGGRQRVPIRCLIACRNGSDGDVEQQDLCLERIAEQARDPQRHVDARPVEQRQRQDLDPADPRRTVIPNRPRAHQHQRQGKILAAGAHGGAAPQVDDQRARIFALVLQMPPQQLGRRALRQDQRRAVRHRARIDGEQVPPGGQHVRTAARWRSRRTRCNHAAIQCSQQRGAFG